MSGAATVAFDLDADPSDALLLRIDPLGVDALEFAPSASLLRAHAPLSAEPADLAPRQSRIEPGKNRPVLDAEPISPSTSDVLVSAAPLPSRRGEVANTSADPKRAPLRSGSVEPGSRWRAKALPVDVGRVLGAAAGGS